MSVSRTYPRVPYAAYDKNGGPLDLNDVLNGIRTDAELVVHYALREMTEQNLALVTYFNGLKPADAGRQMNLKLPSEVKKRFRSGASRLEKMFQEQVVSNLRSWAARVGVVDQTYSGYVSAGWKRTANSSKPGSMQPRLALSATDRGYHKNFSVTPERISLDMVVQGQWVTLHFPVLSRLLEAGCEPGVPGIWIDSRNRVMFGFHGKTDPGRPNFSERYVIGVDVGVINPAAYVVWDTREERIVERSLLGQRARSLSNKIRRGSRQVAALMKVNCAYTSKRCHACQSDLDMSDYSSPVCHSCRVTYHRDVNAAANIAQRVNLEKVCRTRKKHATKTKRIRRSKCQIKPLKHPGTKNRPTPKAPQNQKKTHARSSLPNREVSKRMCPADNRVSAVDHSTWFQTTSGTTVPKDNLSVSTVGWVYPKE